MSDTERVTREFSGSDHELAVHTRSMLRGEGVSRGKFLTLCRQNEKIKSRLMENARISTNSVINLAIQYGDKQLFSEIVTIMSQLAHIQSPWKPQTCYLLMAFERYDWVAEQNDLTMKWILRETVDRVLLSSDFVCEVVNRVSALTGIQTFATTYNPLVHAIRAVRTDIYRALIDKTQLTQITEFNSLPVVYYTVREWREEPVYRGFLWQIIITEDSLRASQQNGTNLLIRAIKMQDQDLVRWLIKHFRAVLNDLESEELPLTEAVKIASKRMIMTLLNRNYSPLTKNGDGVSPLHVSFKGRCPWIVEMLLKHVPEEQLYQLDNVYAAMSADRWWLAKNIMKGIKQRTNILHENFAKDNTIYNCIELIIDSNTMRVMTGEMSIDPKPMERSAKQGWCSEAEPSIVQTNGKDWHGLHCRVAHKYSALLR